MLFNTAPKEGSFKWTNEAKQGFLQLKCAMTQAPVLAFPDFSKTFIIECDASGVGLGPVLMQDRRPIAYFSQAPHGKNLNLSTYEKEMLALVTTIQKWRLYLLGQQFIVQTNHQSLIVTEAQKKWLIKLVGYDFTIEYRKGHENATTYALLMQRDLVGCNKEQQIRNGYVIPDLESINDLRTLLENLDTL
jgi:hypothetical protein